MTNLNELNLNDSILRNIIVTDQYEVILIIDYIHDYESGEKSRKKLVFSNCENAILNLNLAFSGPNSILSGQETFISEYLRLFVIKTDTTAGYIEIKARDFSFRDDEQQ